MQKQKLLQQKIVSIPFTQELKNILQAKKIGTLKEVLDLYVHEWHLEIPGFNYHHQYEIINYISKAGLLKYLKEK